MCGRFVLATQPERLAEHFGARLAPEIGELIAPSWNVAPSRLVLAVTCSPGGERELRPFRWGLVPAFATDPTIGNRLVNARAESVATKPAFRAAFQRRRALVVADGFYEWRKDGAARVPFYFSRRDGAPLAFAGLYELWRPDADTPWLHTCTIITTVAGPDVAGVHDRMPVVLEREGQRDWLAPGGEPASLTALLGASPAGTLVSWPVDPAVGNPRSEGPSLLTARAADDGGGDGEHAAQQLAFPGSGTASGA